jgi:hypothetical protein
MARICLRRAGARFGGMSGRDEFIHRLSGATAPEAMRATMPLAQEIVKRFH